MNSTASAMRNTVLRTDAAPTAANANIPTNAMIT